VDFYDVFRFPKLSISVTIKWKADGKREKKKERKKRELKYRDGGSIIPQHLLRLAL